MLGKIGKNWPDYSVSFEANTKSSVCHAYREAGYGGTVRWSELRGGSETMVLLRQLLGDVLRQLRLRQGRTLREVSAAARVSLGYLSEVERGQKEASSELLASICRALGVPLSYVLREVSDQLSLAELQHEPVMAGAPPAHERLDADREAQRIAETIPATPEEIAGDSFRADMVAA
jgi:transcriptional regulator with XRE-family HTH domain